MIRQDSDPTRTSDDATESTESTESTEGDARGDSSRPHATGEWTRRDFLRAGSASGLAGVSALPSVLLGSAVGLRSTASSASPTSASSPSLAAPDDAPRIRRRVTLGRTGIEIPDISFGTFSLESDESLVRHALDRGVTHFDSAGGYTEGRAEHVLGRALAGERSKVTLTSKFWANPEHTAAVQMRELEASLRRLKTDYIDIYLNHAVNDVERIQSEEWQAFGEQAKRQGKIRAIGMSGHAARLGDCLEYALDHKLVDVILVAYNFAQQPSFKESLKQYLNEWLPSLDIVSSNPRLPEIIARAHTEGVGVMAMKTLKGARLNDMRPYEAPGRTFAQSAFKWVLSEPAVDGLVVTMTSREQVDEYVRASGAGAPDREDLALLARYSALNAGTSCVVGCGDCLSACPAGVPIADVMRTRMYDVDYGQPAIAAREYAALPIGADACLTCVGTPCRSACPSGLAIPELNRDTVERLA